MNTHEFIKVQIERALQKDGFSAAACLIAADEGLEFYMRTAAFKRPPIDECMKVAKKKAQEVDGKKKGRK